MAANASPFPESARRPRLPAAAFDRLFADATVVGGRYLLLRLAVSNDGATRWGFAVSRRTFPSSVMRNRIRRRLRALVRDLRPERPLHLVVVARAAALRASNNALAGDLRRLLESGERRLNA